MDYPKTWISWFTRQLDLELFTDLLTLSNGFTDSLVLSIRFGGFIGFGGFFLLALFIDFIYSLTLFIRSGHWIYLLALFTGFIYSLALSIRFGSSIYLSYLWALVSAYTVFILIANSASFFPCLRKEHPYTSLNIHIPHSHGKNCWPYITSSPALNYAPIATVTSPYFLN